MQALRKLPLDAIELTLFVGNKDHISEDTLFQFDYDVIVQYLINADDEMEFIVSYLNFEGDIAVWIIPYDNIIMLADWHELSTIRTKYGEITTVYGNNCSKAN